MRNKVLTKELFFSRTRDFLDVYLVMQANKSPKTVKSYRDALTIFRRYICDVRGYSIRSFRFYDCTYEFVLDFSTYLKANKKYAPSSVNHRLAAIKSYLGYVSDCDITLQQLYLSVLNVPFLSIPKLQRPVIEKEALAALLAAPNSGRFGIRDRAILVLLFDSAIRLEELLNLKLSDLNFDVDNPYIRIHGKGDKERIVAITKKTVEHLKKYIHYYHQSAMERSHPLFYSIIKENMNTMSERNVERIVKKYADIIREKYPDLPASIYPHMLRRTRVTGLYRDGVDLELLSRILGHSSTTTTRIYAIPSVEMLREAMEKGYVSGVDEKPLWEEHTDELIKLCGLR